MELEIIHPKDFERYGIDPADVPKGMLVSLSMPPMLAGKYGGNVYGIGFVEVFTRVTGSLEQYAKKRSDEYKTLNSYYRSKGLLTRVTKELKPYYLIPIPVASQFNIEAKFVIEQLADLIIHYKAESLKQYMRIALFTHENSIILNELRARFPEDDIECISSFDLFSHIKQSFDLSILSEDINTWLNRSISKFSCNSITEYKNWVFYFISKLYKIIVEEGGFILFNRYPFSKEKSYAEVEFENEKEFKMFMLFCKMFSVKYEKTKSSNRIKVLTKDFLKYLERYYTLLTADVSMVLPEERNLDSIKLEEVERLRHSTYRPGVAFDLSHRETISKFLGPFFELIQEQKLTTPEIMKFWARKFKISGENPVGLFWVGIFKRRAPKYPSHFFLKGLEQDKLSGCRWELIADYRDSFRYVAKVLEIVEELKHRDYPNVLKSHSDRLRLPLKSKIRRHRFLESVLKIQRRLGILQELDTRLNPQHVEGPFTRVLANLDILSLMGLDEGEISEILRIVVGHSPMGRILLGKLHEERLMAIVGYAKGLGADEGLNLMRYLRLMTAAELEASMGKPLSAPQMSELFKLYERYSTFVANPELSMEELVPEQEFFSEEFLKGSVIKRILRLMGYHEFIPHAEELATKGEAQLEVVAGFDEQTLKRLKDVCGLVRGIQDMMEEHWEKSTGFEAFARRLSQSEFHGTGRLFQRVPVEVVLSLLWVILGASEENVLNLNPVLKGLSQEETLKRVSKIKRELGGRLYKRIPWSELLTLREVLKKTGTLFVPGTGLVLSIDNRLNALLVGYQDVVSDIKRCSWLIQKRQSPSSLGQAALVTVEMDQVIQRLSAFVESHSSAPQRIASLGLNMPKSYKRRFEKAVSLLLPAREWLVREILKVEKVYEHLVQLWESSPTLFGRIIGSQDSGVAGKALEALRMYQALLEGDAQGFYDLNTLSLRIKQEFGVAGVGEIGASKEELMELAGHLKRVGEAQVLQALTICLMALSREQLQELVEPPRRFLGEEFDDYVPKEIREIAFQVCQTAMWILNYTRGSFVVSRLMSKREESPHLFLASVILSFLATQAFEVNLICKDFLCYYIYPLIPIQTLEDQVEADHTNGMNRLFRLKGLLYVNMQDVLMHLEGIPTRYLIVKKGLSDVGIGTFEKEVYEATRLYKAFQRCPQEIRFAIESLLNTEIIIFGAKSLLSYLTYENQMKFLATLFFYINNKFEKIDAIDLRQLTNNIDTTYETINYELTGINYEKILDAEIPSIFLAKLNDENTSILFYYAPDLEISKMLDKFTEIESIDDLRSYYFEVLKEASKYYMFTDKIEKSLNTIYKKHLTRLIDAYLQRLSKEMGYIKEFVALEKHKKAAIERCWDMGFPKEAIVKIEEQYEKRKGELRLAKLQEIKETLGHIDFKNEILAYWEEVKTYLIANKAALGRDYMALVAKCFDDALSKF